jgi:predicted RNase H-like HicB family nuclease
LEPHALDRRRRVEACVLRYQIILYWSDEDQVFIAEVPELPGCKTHGDTYEDALAMAKDAMAGWIDVTRELGWPVPQPRGRKLAEA